MNKPTDRGDGIQEPSPIDSLKIRKVGMINPGFRDVDSSLLEQTQDTKQKGMVHFQDRRNVKFLLIALLVCFVVFFILEVKQYHDAAVEAGRSLPETMQNK